MLFLSRCAYWNYEEHMLFSMNSRPSHHWEGKHNTENCLVEFHPKRVLLHCHCMKLTAFCVKLTRKKTLYFVTPYNHTTANPIAICCLQGNCLWFLHSE